MQKALENILASNVFFVCLLIICTGLIVFTLFIAIPAFSEPYPFDSSFITFTPTSITLSEQVVVLDINQDGFGDCIYTKTSNTLITRQFGDDSICQSTITIADILGTGGSTYLGKPYKDRILTISTQGAASPATACQAKGWQYRASNGNELTGGILGLPSSGNVASGQPSGMININNKTFFKTNCGAGGTGVITLNDSPSINGTIGASSPIYNALNHVSWATNKLYKQDGTYYTNHATSNPNDNEVWAITAGGVPTQITAGYYFGLWTSTTYHADSMIQYYRYGTTLPQGNNVMLTTDLIYTRDVIPTANDIISILATLELDYVNPAFDLDNPRFFLKDISNNIYLATIDATTLQYVSYNATLKAQLDTRSFALLRADISDTYDTQTVLTGAGTALSMTLVKPDLTTTSLSVKTNSILPSGYAVQCTGILRFYYVEYINDIENKLPIKTCTGTHSALTLEIKNAFPDTAVRIRDAVLYQDTTPYIWLVEELQTDNTVTFSMLANQCVQVDIKNIQINNGQWINLGFMCHNGLSYKILPNTSELSYQFWAFPLGANHIYDNDNDILQTQVRSNITPFNYVLRLTDNNSNIVYETVFNSTITTDLQTINASTYAKPLRLDILNYDNNNATVYNANLGYPAFLSGIALFANQYLTYEGFNLIFLMPLIFIAMFTRNTIGIGTILTVVFIATMVWLGLISIPDYILYAMFVIAAIGLIAYKTLY